MEISVENKKEQPLLSRTEITGEIIFEKQTPSRQEVRKKLAEALKSKEELLIITKINTIFGEKKASFSAHLYKDKVVLEKIESTVFLKRGKPKEERKQELKDGKETKESEEAS